MPQLHLLHVLGQIARSHAEVNGLVPGERIELLDARLDVVLGHPLAPGDRRQVHIAHPRLVVGDGRVRDIEAGCGLSPHHRDPQPPLRDDL